MTELQNGHATFPAVVEAELPGDQYLSFRCRERGLALPIRLVREIIDYANVTAVPLMPAFVEGVINLRGAVVPVVNLASRFGYDDSGRDRRSCIIILELSGEDEPLVMGLVVDAVDAVLDIEASEIEPSPSFGVGIRTDFIAGMARRKDSFLIVLRIEQVLCVEEIRQVATPEQKADSMAALELTAPPVSGG